MLDVGRGSTTGFDSKIVDLLESQKGVENYSQLVDLLRPMKTHQLTRDGSSNPPGGCPRVTRKQRDAFERLFCSPIGDAEELPQR